jgi:hypothetical protein
VSVTRKELVDAMTDELCAVVSCYISRDSMPASREAASDAMAWAAAYLMIRSQPSVCDREAVLRSRAFCIKVADRLRLLVRDRDKRRERKGQ